MCNYCKKMNDGICSSFCLKTKEQKREHLNEVLAVMKVNKEVRRSG